MALDRYGFAALSGCGSVRERGPPECVAHLTRRGRSQSPTEWGHMRHHVIDSPRIHCGHRADWTTKRLFNFRCAAIALTPSRLTRIVDNIVNSSCAFQRCLTLFSTAARSLRQLDHSRLSEAVDFTLAVSKEGQHLLRGLSMTRRR
jgi:hypothetical protein